MAPMDVGQYKPMARNGLTRCTIGSRTRSSGARTRRHQADGVGGQGRTWPYRRERQLRQRSTSDQGV